MRSTALHLGMLLGLVSLLEACPATPPKNPGQVVQDGGTSPGTSGTGSGTGSTAGSGNAPKDAGSAADGGGSQQTDAATGKDASTSGGEGTPTCDSTSCEPYQHCELVQVTCIRAPCPPLPSCVDNPSCGGFTGKPCPGAGKCKDDPRDSCDPKNGGADCGGVCECYPLPCPSASKMDFKSCACVADPCAAVRCKAGTHCVSNGSKAECAPVDGVACGDNVCTNGQECCNASCGLCVEPGNLCTQQVCD